MTGLDLAKNVFQLPGAVASGAVIVREKSRRDRVLKFFAMQPICTVAMEVCAGSHYGAREIAKSGHEVRELAPSQFNISGEHRKPAKRNQKRRGYTSPDSRRHPAIGAVRSTKLFKR
jgi:hypothetical protein